MLLCDKCSKFGLEYNNSNLSSPTDFIEGNLNSKIWIIGLNPKVLQGKTYNMSFDDLRNFTPNQHPYFKDFKKVSPWLYKKWETKNSTIAHTDLVKCGSSQSSPINIHTGKKLNSKETTVLIDNCFQFLENQIKTHKPLLLICNGAYTSNTIFNHKKFIRSNSSIKNAKQIDSYEVAFNGHVFRIMLSGFIGRIDDWCKRRLGLEIEQNIKDLGIQL